MMDILYSWGYAFYFFIKDHKEIRCIPQINNLFQQFEKKFSSWLNNEYIASLEKKIRQQKIRTTGNNDIIASLTSFPTRIEYTWIAIATIMNQTKGCGRIVLWLAEEQFPEKKLPDTLHQLEQCGLEIRFCDDLKSHKKYYYVMQENPESCVITFDDDIFYPHDTIKKLWFAHKDYPNDIICMTAQQILDLESPPSKWISANRKGELYRHRDDIQAFTGAGTLFPPKSIHSGAFDKAAIRNCAPYADDLWLYEMSRKNSTKTTQMKNRRPFPVAVSIKNNESLFEKNGTAGENLNDTQWEKIQRWSKLNV